MLDLASATADPFADEDATPDPEEAKRIARLDAMGESIAKKRSEAIQARQQSGIEIQWKEDEEFYQGIDDANRDEHRMAWSTKPPGQSTSPQVKGSTRSTVFPNITRPYCDAAAARIADMLLPTDDRSWALKPTPIPDLVGIAEGDIPPDILRQLRAPVVPGGPAMDEASVGKAANALQQQAKAEQEEARKKAQKAETRIEDWNVEGQWHAEIRKVIEDASRCGAGVLKGPFPIKRKVVALMDVAGDEKKPNVLARLLGGIKKMLGQPEQTIEKALIVKEEIKPTSKRIDFWDFYPDGACGENIHDGAYTFERDRLTARKLLELKGTPGYIESQIDACIAEGPKAAVAIDKDNPGQYLSETEDKRFEIWYYHGFADRDDLLAAGCELEDGEHPQIPAMLTIVNNRVIKAALNPLDSGDFPYDVMPWQRLGGMPWGNGVARQGRTAQKIVTAGTRHLMDNGGLSAGPQIVLKQGSITPSDNSWAITPRKVWYWGEDGDQSGSVKDAMAFFEIPSRQKELDAIIQFGMRLMEDSTGLPMLLQGQQGKAPDTVGGMTMLNNNASAVLRRLARTFDDCITEPHIRRYYTWLLQYGEDDEKGDFTIDARGSSALVERDMQSQQMPQILQASGNPTYGIDPRKAMEELLKAWHLDPKRFQFDDEKWEKIVEGLSQKPGDPRVQVEQMRLQDKDKERQFEAAENEKDRQNKIAIEMIDEQLASAELDAMERQALQNIKARLTEKAMEITAQKEVTAATLATDIHKQGAPSPVIRKPPFEPPGRARAGMAYTQ